jgi:hypothetical protein
VATRTWGHVAGNWNEPTKWEEGAVPVAADAVVFDAGSANCAITATATCASIDQTGYTSVLTLNDSIFWTIAGNATFVTGKFVVAGDLSTITLTGSTSVLVTGGCLMGTMIYNKAAGTLTLGDNLSFRAGPMCSLQAAAGGINTGAYVVSGNSAINRLVVKSYVIGTPITVTVTTGTFAFCDFQDIAFSSATNQPAAADTTGNCGGCSQTGGGTLTFTPPALCTFADATGSSSDVTKWVTTGATNRIPLPQDTVAITPQTAAHIITMNMPRMGTDVSFAAADDAGYPPSVNIWTGGMTYSAFGSVNLTGIGETYNSNKTWLVIVRSNSSITTGGKTLTSGNFELHAPSCTLVCADAMTIGNVLTRNLGTLSTAYNITCARMVGVAGTTLTGEGTPPTITCTGSGAAWAESGTVTAGTVNVSLNYVGTTAVTFSGGTNTYNNITIATGAGNGTVTFSGAFTFANMTRTGTTARSLLFTHATIYTMTGTTFLSGADGSVMTIASTSAGTPFHLLKTSGIVICDYLSLQDSHAEGGATWFAGPTTHSTNVSGNNGWIFATPLAAIERAAGYSQRLSLVAAERSGGYAQMLALVVERAAGYSQRLPLSATERTAGYSQWLATGAAERTAGYAQRLALAAAERPGGYAQRLALAAAEWAAGYAQDRVRGVPATFTGKALPPRFGSVN